MTQLELFPTHLPLAAEAVLAYQPLPLAEGVSHARAANLLAHRHDLGHTVDATTQQPAILLAAFHAMAALEEYLTARSARPTLPHERAN